MPEAITRTIDVGGDLDEVTRVQGELEELWSSHGLPEGIEGHVSLALEEVLSNIMRHGGAEGNSAEIRVTFSVREMGFEFEVSDSALDYNPLLRPDPDLNMPLEQRRPGGLGVFLVKKLADEVSYQRLEGRNHLRFFKKFGPSAAR